MVGKSDPALKLLVRFTTSSVARSWRKCLKGLTDTYNRFHTPDEQDPSIVKLRELHAAMDRAVLDAYGWQDIATDCEFLLDYDIDEDEWGDKRRPWRYRWPDEVREEVLARLLELNRKRALEEGQIFADNQPPQPHSSDKKSKKKKAKVKDSGDQFAIELGEA